MRVLTHLILVGLLVFTVTGCNRRLVVADFIGLSDEQRNYLYDLKRWSLTGRVAIKTPKQSFSAHLTWDHNNTTEKILLSGPLGQNKLVIKLDENGMLIQRSEDDYEYSEDPKALLNKYLGIDVPFASLRYWVLGLSFPQNSYVKENKGFVQNDWRILYAQFIQVKTLVMPQKIKLMHSDLRFNLFIDDWNLDRG